ARHVLIDDIADAPSRIARAHFELACQSLYGARGRLHIQSHFAAKEIGRAQIAEEEVGVRHSRVGAATAITGRPRYGAGRFRSDIEQSQPIAMRDRAAASTDLD